MNKIKLLLLGAGICSLVGGALAFKTKGENLFCGTSKNSCPIPSNIYKISTSGPHIDGIYCSTVADTDCKYVTYNE